MKISFGPLRLVSYLIRNDGKPSVCLNFLFFPFLADILLLIFISFCVFVEPALAFLSLFFLGVSCGRDARVGGRRRLLLDATLHPGHESSRDLKREEIYVGRAPHHRGGLTSPTGSTLGDRAGQTGEDTA